MVVRSWVRGSCFRLNILSRLVLIGIRIRIRQKNDNLDLSDHSSHHSYYFVNNCFNKDKGIVHSADIVQLLSELKLA